MIGDPCGIGPEIIGKALATGEVHKYSTPVLVGSKEAMEMGLEIAGLKMEVKKISSLDEVTGNPSVIEVLDSGKLNPDHIALGQESADCGHAVLAWLRETQELARSGAIEGMVLGPINTESLALTGDFKLTDIAQTGVTYTFLISGPLRIFHIADHMPLLEFCQILDEPMVYKALRTMQDSLTRWGMTNPRIGVAGLNPHAHGLQEDNAITPAIERAKAEGMDVEGPIAPDSVFRHCIEDKYDVVLAMFHDQGHIAMKTWGFFGNCALVVGPEYLFASVGHGTAFDIAGKGVASHEMIIMAMKQTGALAGGEGFIKVA
jgi:4-hydroxythreonine-4-phosphate dehydrogenase